MQRLKDKPLYNRRRLRAFTDLTGAPGRVVQPAPRRPPRADRVDYLQLMHLKGTSENRVGEISEISRSMKLMARESNVP